GGGGWRAGAGGRPAPVWGLRPVGGEPATPSWPPWRSMGTAFEPMRPVPPITTIFMVFPPLSRRRGMSTVYRIAWETAGSPKVQAASTAIACCDRMCGIWTMPRYCTRETAVLRDVLG